MITSSRILIGTIVAFVVMVAGFGIGIHFYKKQQEQAPVATAANNPVPIESGEPNHNTYEISPPSNGLVLSTFPVNIFPEGPVAIVRLSANEAAPIKTGQKVFLFDADGELRDSLGEIIAVDQDAEFVNVRIDIEDNPDVPPQTIAKGKIIIDRDKNANRLPYAALLRNEKGESYLWEAAMNDDGTYTAYYKRADVLGGNDMVFTIAMKQDSSNYYILNPDVKLRDGQKINIRKFMYKPPSQYEDQRIARLVEQRKSNIFFQQETQNMLKNAAVAPGAGCPQPPDSAQSFINKIKSMADKPATPSP